MCAQRKYINVPVLAIDYSVIKSHFRKCLSCVKQDVRKAEFVSEMLILNSELSCFFMPVAGAKKIGMLVVVVGIFEPHILFQTG